MKQLLFSLLILVGLNPLFAQTDVVAGGGECKVTGDPDLHPTLGNATLNNCWLAVDVATGDKYWYNPQGAAGDRWDIIPPGTDDQSVDNFSLSGTTLTLEVEDDGQAPHTVDLSALQDGTGTDDQNLTLTGTTLSIEDGNSVDLATLDTDDQSVDNFSLSGTTLTLEVEDDGQAPHTVDLSALQDGTGTDDQNLTLTGTTLSIEDGNSVDLATLDTDDQSVDNFSLSGTTLTLEVEDDSQAPHTVDLSALQDGTGTDDQNLTLTGTTLSIEDGNSVDLATLDTDDQTLSLSGTELTISEGNTVDLGALSGVDTDDQNLSLTGTTLSIDDGNSVDLSALQDGTGTDDQNLTLTGTTLAIEDGNSVDLATLDTDDQGVDNFSLSGTTLTLEVEDDGQAAHTVDLSALQDGTGTDDQNLTLTGTTLSIEDGNSVDLATLDTDDQGVDNFSLSGTTLTLEVEDDGQAPHTVDLSALQDGTGTDDQILSLSGSVLSIEDGNSVDLSDYVDNSEVIALVTTGNPIAEHTSGDGTQVELQETVTTIELDGPDSEIRYTNEAGILTVLDLATIDAFGPSTVDQTVAGHQIARHLASNGTSTNINETITDIALSGTTLSYDRRDGTTTNVDLSGIGGGGGGSFGAVTVNVGPSTTHVHTGEDHYFIEANMLTGGNEIIIDESEPNGSVIEVWLTRSAGDVSFTNTSIRTGNDAFASSVSGVAGDSFRFIKIRGIWAAVYKGQY